MHFTRLKNSFTLDFSSYCNLACACFTLPEWQRAAIETCEWNLSYQSDFLNESQKESTETLGAHWCPRMTVFACQSNLVWEGSMLIQNGIQHCYFSNKPWHTGPAKEVQRTWVLIVAGQNKYNKIRASVSWGAAQKEDWEEKKHWPRNIPWSARGYEF